MKKIDIQDIIKEISISTSRSTGPGGQNVNKVETKVSLSFNINDSSFLSIDQKEKLLIKLKSKLDKKGILTISSERTRSQLRNKEDATKKLVKSLNNALTEQKKRKKSKPSKASIEKRIKVKKQLSDKKSLRSKNFKI